MTRIALIPLSLIGTLLLSPICGAEIYKWVDEKGNVHFSDKKPEQFPADEVDLKINSYEGVTYDSLPPDRQNQQAGNAQKVVMYSTSWCGYCKKARNYFNTNGISFVELDIEKDARAKQEYDRMGAKGVPVILVGKKRMNGFSVAGFQRIYK